MSKVATVTNERKKELLVEARKDRLSWIQSSKIPYQQFEEDPTTSASVPSVPSEQASQFQNASNHQHHQHHYQHHHNPIHQLSSSNLIQSIPSSLKVLDVLLEQTSNEEKQILIQEWNSELRIEKETKRQEELVGSIDDHAFVFYYNEIIERLCLPECKDIVQGMRHFVKSLQELSCATITTSNSTSSGSSSSTKEEHLTKLKNATCTYLEALYDTLASHPLWRETNGLSNDTKMMLDTFVYSKCYKHIMHVMMDKELESDEVFMQDRLQFLNEFIEPVHLEIHDFWETLDSNDSTTIPQDDDDDKDDKTVMRNDADATVREKTSWEKDLVHPIALLHGLGKLYSPAQMLRCILDVYRGINDTLKHLFLQKQDGGGKAPSADDILPTLILTVICARPKNIMSILTFVEWFATDEQKRGESGYAFATLYSAMHFIKELDLQPTDDKGDDGNTGKPTLQMSQAEMKELLRKHLERKEETTLAESNMNGKIVLNTDDVPSEGIPTSPSSSGMFQPISIPLHEVTAARLRGENLKDWAQRYIDSNQLSWEQAAIVPDDEAMKQSENVYPNETLSLPDGFNRSYKYLSTDPNNVRYADIPGILEEYSMLVRAVETLISERNALIRHNRKDEKKLKKERLEASLAEIEKDTK